MLALVGGTAFLLAFVHFVVDWGFQSHTEAMKKARDFKVRARHCYIYTLGFAPLMYFMFPDWRDLVFSLTVLWWSHFLIDTYIPVYFWAKYLRKPPQMVKPPNELEGFTAFAKEPLGLVLVIAMDQAWHILFLFPIAVLYVIPEVRNWAILAGSIGLLGLFLMVVLGSKRLTK